MTEVFGVYAKAHQAVSTLTWPALQTAARQYFGNDAANLKYQHLLAAAQAAGIQH